MVKLYTLGNQLFASGFSFIIIIISARLLDVNQFGVISLVIMISLLVSIASQSFVNMPIMSNAFKKSNKEVYIYDNFLLQLILITALVVVFSFFYFLNFFDMQQYFSISSIIIYFSFFQVYEFIKKILFIENNHKLVTYLEIIKFLFIIAIFSYMFFMKISLQTSEVLYIISGAYLLFIIFSFSNIKFNKFNVVRFKQLLKENYMFGKWIFLSNIIQNLNSNLYIYISAFFLPVSLIGALNAIRSLIGFSTVIFLALDNYLIPKFSQLSLNLSIHKLTIKINKIYTKIAVLLVVSYLIISIYANDIIYLVYGEKFVEYSYFMYIFLIANIFMFYTRPIIILVKTVGLTKIMFTASIPTFIFTLFGAYPIIYLFKIDGALFIMCSVQLIHLISLKYFYIKELKNERL